ncbi:MAG: helix-turn-helix domain-containing protein [Nitrospirae bacterium]|nr:helix-turn-helix domain-containing protein [Nitrospirota bacterium]
MGARIKQIRMGLGINQADFGALFGVSQEAVSTWEHGGYPDLRILLKIARRGTATVEWLVTGKKTKKSEKRVPTEKRPLKMGGQLFQNTKKYKPFPLLYDQVSNGPPKRITKDVVEEYLWLPPILQRKSIFLVRQKDNSMDPLLRKEDVVALSERSEETHMPKEFLAAAWLPEDGITVRWFSSNKSQWILRSENASYPSIFIDKKTKFRFFRVVWWWGIQDFK